MSTSAKGLLAVTVLAAAVGSPAAFAEVTANVGVTSNYIWRGVTQTGDDAAVSGGLDYSHDSGFYAGTWTSNLGGGGQYELDLYAGYAGEAGGFSYDLGIIRYAYPVGDVEADLDELYVNLGVGLVSASVAYTLGKEGDQGDEHDIYASLGASFDINEGLAAGVLVGSYDFDDSALEDYAHVQLSLTKSTPDFGDFVFAVDKNDLDDSGAGEDDPRVSVTWSKGFDL